MPWRTRYRLTASARRSESFLLYASPPTESVCPSITTLVSGLSLDRKSTRLNSSHGYISYAVFCLKKKKDKQHTGLDYFLRVLSLSGLSFTSFWLGLLVLMSDFHWFCSIRIYDEEPYGFCLHVRML